MTTKIMSKKNRQSHQYIYCRSPITEEFKNFWIRMEDLFGHPISPNEIHKIKERMDELEKENTNDRCKNLP